MKLLPIALNLDGSIPLQKELASRLNALVDFSDFRNSLRLFATENAAADFNRRLTDLRSQNPAPWLTFCGSGDYHHLTLSLLETLPASLQPFSLILIDNHPDWFNERPSRHCGNWVHAALSLPGIHRIILIAQNSADIRWYRMRAAPLNDLCSGKLSIHPLTQRSVQTPLWRPRQTPIPDHVFKRFLSTEFRFKPLRDKTPSLDFLNLIAGSNVYLSIDKDCLNPCAAATDWDQGDLSLSELTQIVKAISIRYNIIGADIVGDRAPNPLQGLWKRLDAGRLFRPHPGDMTEATRLNQIANLALLDPLVLPD